MLLGKDQVRKCNALQEIPKSCDEELVGNPVTRQRHCSGTVIITPELPTSLCLFLSLWIITAVNFP